MGFLKSKRHAVDDRRWVKSNVYEIAITGILIGLNLACQYIFSFIPVIPPYITISPNYFVVAISCYLLRRRAYSLALVLISPWLWFVAGVARSVNVADFVMEYWLPIISLWSTSFVRWFEGSGKRPEWSAWLAAFASLLFTQAVVRLFLSTWAGVLWYQTTWTGSMIINWPNMYIDLALSVGLFAGSYLAFFRLRKVVR